jgi:hypothetical protein
MAPAFIFLPLTLSPVSEETLEAATEFPRISLLGYSVNRGNLPLALGASSLEAFIADLDLSVRALNINKRLPHRDMRLTLCRHNVFIKLPRRSFWAHQRESIWGVPRSPS